MEQAEVTGVRNVVITYQENRKAGTELVKLDNKIVGEIRTVVGGYQYFPKGQKEGGAYAFTHGWGGPGSSNGPPGFAAYIWLSLCLLSVANGWRVLRRK